MERQSERTIGILGVGNLLMGDEGFGVHFINYLEEHFRLPEGIRLMDGGTAGIMTAPFIEGCRFLFVIDTVALEREPAGSIHLFTDEEVRAGSIQSRMSPHQVGLLQVLELCRLTGRAPQQTEFITVVPEKMETGIALSQCLLDKLPEIVALLGKRIFLTTGLDTFAGDLAVTITGHRR